MWRKMRTQGGELSTKGHFFCGGIFQFWGSIQKLISIFEIILGLG
jgi:hypothetical protein